MRLGKKKGARSRNGPGARQCIRKSDDQLYLPPVATKGPGEFTVFLVFRCESCKDTAGFRGLRTEEARR